MIRMGVTIYLCVVAAILAGFAADANAWVSDTFKSPTGNLLCRYHWAEPSITCGAVNLQLVIHMTATGRPVQGQRLSWRRGTSFPVLLYGQTWNRGQPISCRSFFNGMRCVNQAGWSFLISRTGVIVSRYGQALYRI